MSATCEKAEFDGNRGPFVEGFDTDQVIADSSEANEFYLLFSHYRKAGQDQL